MSDYVTITNPNSVVIPAIPEKTYPNLYCREFYVYPPNEEKKQILNSISRPYNKELGEMYPFEDRDYQFVIGDIFAEAERVPLFKQVLGGLLTCVNLGIAEKDLIEKISKLEDGEAKDALSYELTQVHAAMGIV